MKCLKLWKIWSNIFRNQPMTLVWLTRDYKFSWIFLLISAFEDRQNHLRALRSRQDLFQEEGVLNMILDTIDKFSQMESLPDFAGLIGEETQVTL
jgi:hypothetical protein